MKIKKWVLLITIFTVSLISTITASAVLPTSTYVVYADEEHIDEAAAAWALEQAALQKEREAALRAYMLQQEQAAKEAQKKKRRKTTNTTTSTATTTNSKDSALSNQISSIKESAASQANAEFAEEMSDEELTDITDGAVVTDLTNEIEEYEEIEDTVAEEVIVETTEEEIVEPTVVTVSTSSGGSTDAAMSKYIQDRLLADTSEVSVKSEETNVVAIANQGPVLSKTSKSALVAVLVVVLAVILIIGLVIIMVKMGYWNIGQVDDYSDDDYDISVNMIE